MSYLGRPYPNESVNGTSKFDKGARHPRAPPISIHSRSFPASVSVKRANEPEINVNERK